MLKDKKEKHTQEETRKNGLPKRKTGKRYGNNKREDKKAFLLELEKVLDTGLPHNYAVLTMDRLRGTDFSKNISHLHSVKAGKAVNWRVLQVFADLAEVQISRPKSI